MSGEPDSDRQQYPASALFANPPSVVGVPSQFLARYSSSAVQFLAPDTSSRVKQPSAHNPTTDMSTSDDENIGRDVLPCYVMADTRVSPLWIIGWTGEYLEGGGALGTGNQHLYL